MHAWNEAGESAGSNCVEFDVVDKIKSPIPATITGYSGVYNGKSHSINIKNLPKGSNVYYRTSTKANWSRTKPTRTSVGITNIYYKITNDKYAKALTGTRKIVINKAKQTASAKAYNGMYDGKSKTINITKITAGSKIYYRTSSKGSWITKQPTRTNAGTTKVYYKITNSNCTSTKLGTANIMIKKAVQKASVKGYSGTYNGKSKIISIANITPDLKYIIVQAVKVSG